MDAATPLGTKDTSRMTGKCWAVTRTAGVCECCGYEARKNDRGRYDRHGGRCRECDGTMRCRRLPSRGRERCLFHGGRSSASGPSHGSYKHGRYSKVLKGYPGFRKLYDAAMKDPDLHKSADEIAVLVAQMQQTLENLGQHGNARVALELEKSIRRLGTEFTRAANDLLATDPDTAAVAGRLHELGRFEGEMGRALALAADLIAFRSAFEHWRGLADQTSRLRERDAKRQAATATSVSLEQFTHIMGTLGDILVRHLDRERFPGLLACVNRDITTSLGGYVDAPLAIGEASAC